MGNERKVHVPKLNVGVESSLELTLENDTANSVVCKNDCVRLSPTTTISVMVLNPLTRQDSANAEIL